jgi:hypothetical protein
MYTYDTVSQAVKGLKEIGYTTDFNIENDCIVWYETSFKLTPEEFEITEVHGMRENLTREMRP